MYDLRNNRSKESDGYFALGASCPYVSGNQVAQLKRSVWEPLRSKGIGTKWAFLPGVNWARAVKFCTR